MISTWVKVIICFYSFHRLCRKFDGLFMDQLAQGQMKSRIQLRIYGRRKGSEGRRTTPSSDANDVTWQTIKPDK